jgi:Tol biopolymer transport system component
MDPAVGEKRQIRDGRMPSFSTDGGKIVLVSQGMTDLSWINSTGSGGGDWLSGYSGIGHPRFSPGDSLLAFSAQDGERGRRIRVWDTRRPEYFPDLVTDPDPTTQRPTQDGSDDDYPTWSPNSRYVAYKSTLREGMVRDAIFLTVPSKEPEPNVKLVTFEPGRQLEFLRWHPNGDRILFILDGDVYMYILPVQYRDPAP